jgi:beta-lactamase regulating signal transducer with metallopeptidase domain
MTLLLASVVDVAVIVGLSVAAAAALTRRSASLRHAVLAAAIVAGVCAPALEWLIPPQPVLWWGDAAPVASSGVIFTSGACSGVATPDWTALQPAAVPWTALLVTVWLVGGVVTLAGLLTGLLRLKHLVRRCTPVPSGLWRDTADELSRAIGLRRQVALLQSRDPSLLVTCGLFKPKIILPAGTAAWHADRRRIVLAHELAHIRRRDGATQLVGELLRVIHWFNPLVWLVCRRVRQESEYACDDAVLQAGVGATEYATHLLEIARHAVGRHRAWAAAPAIAHPSTLERRIAAMLNDTRRRDPLSRRAWAAAVLTTVAVIVPLAAASVAPSPPDAAPVGISAGDTALAPSLEAPRSTRGTPPAPSAALRSRLSAAGGRAAAASARQAPAEISGTVLDQSGGTLPGARLTLTSVDSGILTAITSDTNGRFRFRELPPAQYELTASLPGFRTVTNVMPLAAGSVIARVITLPIGSVEETIHVVCGTPAAAGAPPRPSSLPQVRRDRGRSASRGGLAEAWGRALDALLPVLSAQQAAPVAPVRVGGNISAPTKLVDVHPVCPSTFIPATETLVTLAARIGVDGYTNDVTRVAIEADTTAPPEFTQSALDAVRQWQFTPARLNGSRIEVNMTIRVFYRRG